MKVNSAVFFCFFVFLLFFAINTRTDINVLKYRPEECQSLLADLRKKKHITLGFTGEVVSHDVVNGVTGFRSLPRVKLSKTLKSIFKTINICITVNPNQKNVS